MALPMPAFLPRLLFMLLSMVALGIALTGCLAGPTYVRPVPQAPATWSAPQPHDGSVEAMDTWWAQFDDPAIARLVALAEADSPTLASAWAAIEKARASQRSTNSGLFPGVNGNASATRSGQGDAEATSTRHGAVDASWEIDLFGKLRRQSQAADARIEARIGDWHDARISLAAEVADTYVQYRACELLVDVYQREIDSIRATDKATSALVQAGFTAPAEAVLSSASVASTASTLIAQQAGCDLLVKALVALTGQEETSLRGVLAQGQGQLPQPAALDVAMVPADVLRQRPDLAALERQLAAASAEIGVARADLYPSLSLSGSISASAGNLVSGNPGWSFGPSLSIPLFDGGRRRAAVDSAQADYDSALAAYRQGVRQAIKDVEQSLVALDRSGRQAEQAARAAREYRRYLRTTEVKWRVGTENLLTLEQTRRSALSAEVQELTLQRERVQAWISLYKALGGDWTGGMPAHAPQTTASPRTPQHVFEHVSEE
jgi:outer membrane protein, multidrug efflux system